MAEYVIIYAGLHVRWYYIVDFMLHFHIAGSHERAQPTARKNASSKIGREGGGGTNFFDQIATKSQRRKHNHDNEMITEHNINKV